MTPKNEATPRPWVLADYGEGPIEIHADFGHAIATMTTFPTRAHQRIDATLIVTAVNAYDAHRELVEAAKLAADLLTDIRRGVAPPDAPGDLYIINDLRGAIAKVKVE